jgi:hypothetical protein
MITVFSFIGAMISSALLVEPSFMLKLNSFTGVKVAHVVPILLVIIILLAREEDWSGIIAGTAKSSIRVWQLIAGLIILAGLAILVIRTGNDNLGIVSGLETKFRNLLDNVLGVRPRTKELLIGHPLMLILIYFGYQYKMVPVLAIGIIGQISIINTYSHIHTPVMISLLRTAHGLWLGILIGVIAILILEWIIRRTRAFRNKHADLDASL